MLLLTAFVLATSHVSPSIHRHAAAQFFGPPPPPQIVWTGYGGNAQHTATSNYSPTGYGYIAWAVSQDATNESNIIHWGSASLTGKTIIYPYRTASGSFQFVGRSIANSALVWYYPTDFQFSTANDYGWIPPVSGTLLPDGSFVGPKIAGGAFVRGNSDLASQNLKTYNPCGNQYADNLSTYNNNVVTVTPITADASGNVYYGIRVNNPVPNGLTNCYVKMSEAGKYTFFNCPSGFQPSYNAGPAISPDGTKVYVAETNGGSAYLVELSTVDMSQINQVLLIDPLNGQNAETIPNSTASPMVGPDGDVFYGVMGSPFWDHGDRGFLLHFNSSLVPNGVPGAFGWDDTPSVVPASSVPLYHGAAKYLLFCKYNNYADGLGGSGKNMVAVLDPTTSFTEPIYGLTAMNPVIQVEGVTPDPANGGPASGAVKEWCINSAAVDVKGKNVVVNSEDGNVYNLSLTTGTLTKSITITGGASEAYTSTLIGADGTIFGVSEAKIFAIRGLVGIFHPTGPIASLPPKKSVDTKR